VAYVDTRGWLTGARDFSDYVHPSVAGHARVAARLATVISRTTGLRAY
jgi:lysophospholipase L1-like esterase